MGFDVVRSVMQTHVVSTDAQASLREAAQSLKAANAGTLAVMDGPEIVGIVSERDLVRALAEGADPDQRRVVDVMSGEPRYLTLGDNLATALEVMVEANVRHLPVVDEGDLVGIVSMRDVARALLA